MAAANMVDVGRMLMALHHHLTMVSVAVKSRTLAVLVSIRHARWERTLTTVERTNHVAEEVNVIKRKACVNVE